MRHPIATTLLFGVVLTLCGGSVAASDPLPTTAIAAGGFEILSADPSATAQTLAVLSAMDAPEEQQIWIFLKDKGIFDATSYTSRLQEVGGELNEHATLRRARIMSAPYVDYVDIPVLREYVAELERSGVTIRMESRWLNAVSARATLETWNEVSSLPFVSKLALVRGGTPQRPTPSIRAEQTTGARGALDYGASFGQLDEINIVAAHALGLTGAGVRVAMLDTGYYQDHDAFVQLLANGQLIAQYDFINDDAETQDGAGDPFGQHLHGTLTWSIVSGFDEGELIGAAYGADFLLAKTEDTSMEDPVEEDYWVAGMEWADANGADVISSSLGYKDWYDYEDLDGQTAVTTIAADLAVTRGIVVCTAMGNEGTSDWYFLIAPADANLTVSVGGSTPTGETWLQTSHGPTADGRIKPEVVARASSTTGAASPEDHLGEGYRQFDGTSVATPLVAGAVALLLEAHPTWTPEVVREALMMTADNAATPDNDRGWGRIDVLAALDYAPASVPEFSSTLSAPQILVSPNPFSSRTSISLLHGFSSEPALLELFSLDGRRVLTLPVASGAQSLSLAFSDGTGPAPSPGVYLLRASQGEIVATAKVVLQRP